MWFRPLTSRLSTHGSKQTTPFCWWSSRRNLSSSPSSTSLLFIVILQNIIQKQYSFFFFKAYVFLLMYSGHAWDKASYWSLWIRFLMSHAFDLMEVILTWCNADVSLLYCHFPWYPPLLKRKIIKKNIYKKKTPHHTQEQEQAKRLLSLFLSYILFF